MSFYLVDDIEQGTAKWLQWRRGVIGASEAAIIMGENRLHEIYKSLMTGGFTEDEALSLIAKMTKPNQEN
jgi:siroheme synthase